MIGEEKNGWLDMMMFGIILRCRTSRLCRTCVWNTKDHEDFVVDEDTPPPVVVAIIRDEIIVVRQIHTQTHTHTHSLSLTI